TFSCVFVAQALALSRELTALGAGVLGAQALFGNTAPLFTGVLPAVSLQVALVGVFVRQFAQERPQQPAKALHNSSVCSRERTNGASRTGASLVPRRMPIQTR